MKHDIETKLCAARTHLILDQPFFGALVLRLPMIAADSSWCRTSATDTQAFYYNPAYIEALDVRQVEFVLAHEALHCALSHFTRRAHREKHRWDLACDFAINPLLLAEGLIPPGNLITFLEYAGMTAEEIYPLLEEREDEETMDQHLYDQEHSAPGNNHLQAAPQTEDGPPRLSRAQREILAGQWQQHLASAAQRAAQAGKLSGALASLMDALLQPQLPWRALLAHYLSNSARDDYTYRRLSRREGEAILPSLRSAAIDVVVVVDTSGSVSEVEMNEFMNEIGALKGQLRARITLLACDTALAQGAPWIFEAWEELVWPKQVGRGGTSFIPPFLWLDQHGHHPDVLIYFTDGQGPFPPTPPFYPVLWLVKGKAGVPWGRRIQLN